MAEPDTIVVIGTGYVGLPAALMWARAGQKVVGVDIDENVVRAINERTMLINEHRLEALLQDPQVQCNLVGQSEVPRGDVFVIAVPTPLDDLKKVANLSHVGAALESVCPVLEPGNLVLLESTVPPMTCRNLLKPLIERRTGLRVPEDIMVAHCPERILPGNVFDEIVGNDRIIGGMNSESAERAAEVYATFVEGRLLKTDDISAELAKLMENTFRDVNIALANEFSHICENLDVEVRDVIGLANRHPRVNILSPGIGVGGHCIPVDPWFLKEVAPYHSRMISTARQINDEVPVRIAARIRRAVRDVSAPKIIALGATYKRDCEDVRESPALTIVQALRRDGYAVEHYDPLVAGMEYGSLAEVAKDADLIAVLVAHKPVMSELEARGDIVRAVMRRPSILAFDE